MFFYIRSAFDWKGIPVMVVVVVALVNLLFAFVWYICLGSGSFLYIIITLGKRCIFGQGRTFYG